MGALALSMFLVSCKKDGTTSVTPTKENLTGSYKLTAASFNGQEVLSNDMYFEACERDDVYRLNADMSYERQDAGTVCSPAGDESGSWEFTSSTAITIDGVPYKVDSFDGRSLKVSLDMGQNMILKSTFTKQ